MKELAAALAAFQAEAPTVSKGKTAKVPTKAGGSYSYTYANLADVVEAAYPLLSKHGLSFSCVPRNREGGGYELVGILLHSSGESLEGSLPLSGNTPQELGSSLTYMRRYLLGAMTGLVTDDDDDGAAASRRPQAPARKETGEVATDAQQRALHAAATSREWTRDDLMERLSRQFQRQITSTADLTKAEASQVLDKLKEDR